MNLDKAIEILSNFMDLKEDHEPLDFDDAVALGNEASKAISDFRRGLVVDFLLPLPSETPDADSP